MGGTSGTLGAPLAAAFSAATGRSAESGLVAMEEKRVNTHLLWAAAVASASGFAIFAVFYGTALLIEHRRNQRGARLRSRLHR